MQQRREAGKIRVLVVDDEPLARSNLTTLLSADPGDRTVVDASESRSMAALAAIRADRPDLVFLDVQMPECDGFDVLEMLGEELAPAIIFVTAYDRYASTAGLRGGGARLSAQTLRRCAFRAGALARAKERLNQGWVRPSGVERLAIKGAGQVVFLGVTEIDWIEAADYYVSLHVGARTHLLRRRSLSDASNASWIRAALVGFTARPSSTSTRLRSLGGWVQTGNMSQQCSTTAPRSG